MNIYKDMILKNFQLFRESKKEFKGRIIPSGKGKGELIIPSENKFKENIIDLLEDVNHLEIDHGYYLYHGPENITSLFDEDGRWDSMYYHPSEVSFDPFNIYDSAWDSVFSEIEYKKDYFSYFLPAVNLIFPQAEPSTYHPNTFTFKDGNSDIENLIGCFDGIKFDIKFHKEMYEKLLSIEESSNKIIEIYNRIKKIDGVITDVTKPTDLKNSHIFLTIAFK